MGYKMEEPELLMCDIKPDIRGKAETWWDSSHDRDADHQEYKLLGKQK